MSLSWKRLCLQASLLCKILKEKMAWVSTYGFAKFSNYNEKADGGALYLLMTGFIRLDLHTALHPAPLRAS